MDENENEIHPAFKIKNPYTLKTWDEWDDHQAHLNDLAKKICEGYCDPPPISFFKVKDDFVLGVWRAKGGGSIELADVGRAFAHELAHHFQHAVFNSPVGHDHVFGGAFALIINIIRARELDVPVSDPEFILKDDVERQNKIPSNNEPELEPGWETPFRIIHQNKILDAADARIAVQCPTFKLFYDMKKDQEKAERESKSHWLVKAARWYWRADFAIQAGIPMNLVAVLMIWRVFF